MPEITKHRDSVRFADNVSPNTDTSYSYDVQEDATIEEVMVRFYSGPRLDLRVRPTIEVNSGRSVDPVDLIEYSDDGYQFVAGDDDVWIFPISESVTDEDQIVIQVENIDASNDYDFVCDVTLDTESGVDRAISSLLGRISGRIPGVSA